MVEKSVVKMINEYILELQKNDINLTKVILYGSYAKGTANLSSDIDLMLVSPEFDNDSDSYLGIIWKLTEKSDYKIEPYHVGKIRFETDDVSPIILVAKEEGLEFDLNIN